MNRIFYLITRSILAGAQTHLLDLLRHTRARYEIVLGAGEEGFLLQTARALDIETHVFPDLLRPIAPLRDWRAYKQILAALQDLSPDLVHAHSSKAGILGRLAAARLEIPAIFTAHGWGFTDGTPMKQRLVARLAERYVARSTAKIITVSDADRSLALKYNVADEDKLVTITNGISDDPHRADPGRTGPVHIVMVARFSPQKDHMTLLRAIRDIERSADVVLVGDGSTRYTVEREAQRLGVSDRVRFLGEQHDLPQILADSHVFVLSSRWEGMPISILEAMRTGLPVVATDVGGVREAVSPNRTGLLVSRGNHCELHDALAMLIGNPALRRQLGSAGRLRYERDFTASNMAAKTHRIYADVLA